MKKAAVSFQIWLLVSVFAAPLIAQQTTSDTLITNELQPVTVTAYRLETTDLATPLSLTVIGKQQLQSGTQQLSLDEALVSVPGVLVQNGSNFAQDIKLSIRGFGARSAFGIRGVKILVDGFPETTPDGTSQVDAIDPGSLVGIGIIRSGTGGLYGNASGGFVNFNTMSFDSKRETELGASIGMYGFGKYQLRTTGGKADKFYYSLNGSYTTTDGYRDHSAMKNWLFNGGFFMPIDSSLTLRGVVTYVNSPIAEDPGALTEKQFSNNPSRARDNNLHFDAKESVRQFRTGFALTKEIKKKHTISASFFQSARDFIALLPFDYVELQRAFTGGNFSYGFKTNPNEISWEFKLGLDLATQTDDRKRFENYSGNKGDIYADQTERFNTIGYYIIQKIQFGRHLSLLPAIRFDHNQASVEDRYLADFQLDTFHQNFKIFNPSLGIDIMAFPTLHFYMNGSRNYDVPTILEITQPKDFGAQLINRDLQPERSISFELGSKFLAFHGRLRAELAIYRVWLKDEIVQITGMGFLTHYENAGKSNRKGIELGMTAQLANRLFLRFNYTYSDFKYEEYLDYGGNRLPGVPPHMGGIALEYAKPSGLSFTVGNQRIGEIYPNNDNKTKTKTFNNAYIRLEYRMLNSKIKISLFGGINNLLNKKYAANIRINSGENSYEPAPPLNIYAGIKIKF